jgi:hypothetical protein
VLGLYSSPIETNDLSSEEKDAKFVEEQTSDILDAYLHSHFVDYVFSN